MSTDGSADTLYACPLFTGDPRVMPEDCEFEWFPTGFCTGCAMTHGKRTINDCWIAHGAQDLVVNAIDDAITLLSEDDDREYIVVRLRAAKDFLLGPNTPA